MGKIQNDWQMMKYLHRQHIVLCYVNVCECLLDVTPSTCLNVMQARQPNKLIVYWIGRLQHVSCVHAIGMP